MISVLFRSHRKDLTKLEKRACDFGHRKTPCREDRGCLYL